MGMVAQKEATALLEGRRLFVVQEELGKEKRFPNNGQTTSAKGKERKGCNRGEKVPEKRGVLKRNRKFPDLKKTGSHKDALVGRLRALPMQKGGIGKNRFKN